MFDIECPRCKSAIGLGLSDFFRQRVERRDCWSCRMELELSNSALFFVFNGLMFGGLMMVLGYWGLQQEWLRVIIVAPLCWLMAPVFVQIGGRWRVCSERVRDAVGVRRWLRIGSISAWVFGGAVTMAAISFAVHYRRFVFGLEDWIGGGGSDATGEFVFGMRYFVLWSIVVAVAAFAVMLIARWKARRFMGTDEGVL
ncbi:MAG: hypothetical protein ACYS8I_04690 [Planctomycetota bacterium]